jgi:hypothetical protein
LLLDLVQQGRGLLDLEPDRLAVGGRKFQLLKGALCDGDDLVQLGFQRWRRWRRRWLLRLQKQSRLGENPLARQPFGAAPGVVECGRLARGPVLLSEHLRHAQALFRADSRHRRQIAHRDLRGDLALAHHLLHLFRQCFHQRQTARHPGRATVETAPQFLDRTVEVAFHLGQQPALFERGFRLAVDPQRASQHQSFGLAHVPHHGVDRVAAQLLKRGDALVAVNDQVPATGFGNDDDRDLLAGLSQRSEEPPVARRVAHPEVLQAAVQLMKLEGLRHGSEYAAPGDWSFAAKRGCCLELPWDQWDSRVTGLSRHAEVGCRQLQ